MDRLYYLEVTTPANTPQSSPQSTPFPLEDNTLVYVDINVPPGNSATLGFRVMWAQQQVIPWGNNSWLLTDDEKVHVECNFAMTTSGLVVETYNVDIFPHTIYIRALVRDMTIAAQQEVNAATGSVALPASVDIDQDTSGIDTGVSDFDTDDTGSDYDTVTEDDTDTDSDTDTDTDTDTTAPPAPVTVAPAPTPPGPTIPPVTSPAPPKKKPKPVRKVSAIKHNVKVS
jgi:hypothetical protein